MNQNALPPVAPAPQQPPLPSASPPSARTPPQPGSDNSTASPTNSPSTQRSIHSATGNMAAVPDTAALAKKLQAMLLENAKQQLHVNTTPLDKHHRFENPSDFLQFSTFTDAVRERIRGKLWSAQFEAWISQQLGPDVMNKYKNMTQLLPLRNDYMPMDGFLVQDIKFAGIDDFELRMYQQFFGTEQMQRKVFNHINKFRVGRQSDDSFVYFDSCTTLCNVAIRALALLTNKYVVPELVQVSMILNHLPILASQKLQEWFPNVDTQPETHVQLVEFATRIDNLYKAMNKNRPMTTITSILKVDVNGYRRTRGRAATPHPRGKRYRSVASRSPSQSRSQSPMMRSRSQSPLAFRSQSHYKGSCAKCGKIGHSIAQCRNATESEKTAFFKKVKESKDAMKKNDKKKVRFADDAKTKDGPVH